MLMQRRLGGHPFARRQIAAILALAARAAHRRGRRVRHVAVRRAHVVALGRGVLRGCLGGMFGWIGRRLVVALAIFEKRIRVERLPQFLLEFQRRQLQQTKRLLKPRREGQVLSHLERKRD
jgi:hypothetical protein